MDYKTTRFIRTERIILFTFLSLPQRGGKDPVGGSVEEIQGRREVACVGVESGGVRNTSQ